MSVGKESPPFKGGIRVLLLGLVYPKLTVKCNDTGLRFHLD
jgi:hypothetical protein